MLIKYLYFFTLLLLTNLSIAETISTASDIHTEIEYEYVDTLDDDNIESIDSKAISKKGSLLDIEPHLIKDYFSDSKKISTFSGFYEAEDQEYKSVEWSVLIIKENYHAWRFGISLFQEEDRLTEKEGDHTTMLSVFGTAYLHANTPYVNPFIGIGAVAGLNVCTFIEAGLEGSINAATNNSQIQQPDGSYEPLDIQLCPTYTVFALYQEFGLSIDIAGVHVFPFIRRYFDRENYHGELSYGISINSSIFSKN